jgi:protein TonB
MLERLLESRGRRVRSPLGVATSVSAHLAIVVIAVHATAQLRPRTLPTHKVVIVPFVPSPPRSEQTVTSPAGTESRSLRVPVVAPISVDPKLPPIDFTPALPTLAMDFPAGVGGNAKSGGANPVAVSGTTFTADQVERQVGLLPGAPVPEYPEALRAAGVEGKVIAQFTVDERGLVDMDSVRFVLSDNSLFEWSVRTVLRRTRFAPAQVAGRNVRQLVQMPFVFAIRAR